MVLTFGESLIIKAGAALDKARAKSFPPGATLELLKISETGIEQPDGTLSNDYETVAAVANGWFAGFDKYRNQTRIQIATIDDDFGAKVNDASYVRMNNVVYKIIEGDDGTIPPVGDSLFWQIYCKTRGEEGFK